MVDLSLDLDPAHKNLPSYKDLLVINGDLVLTSDANPNGTNNILQDILQRIQMFLGEWFLNSSEGVPWLQQILVKNPDQSKIDAILQNIILGAPGVLQLTQYSVVPNFLNRTANLTFSANTTAGKVNYSGNIAPINGGQ